MYRKKKQDDEDYTPPPNVIRDLSPKENKYREPEVEASPSKKTKGEEKLIEKTKQTSDIPASKEMPVRGKDLSNLKANMRKNKSKLIKKKKKNTQSPPTNLKRKTRGDTAQELPPSRRTRSSNLGVLI